MPAALISAFEAKTGIKILEGYGLTEGACVSSVNPAAGERHAGSIGLPIPYQRMEAVVLDGDGRFQRMADVDEAGVIAISGPNVFKGYLDPGHNAGVWIDIDGERWLNTGDLGRRDADGYFWSSSSGEDTISIPGPSKRRWRAIRASPWSRRLEVLTPTPARCPSPTFS